MKLFENEITYQDGSKKKVKNEILLENGIKIKCPNEILCSIEMQDRIVVLLNWYKALNLYNINQNIFCYSKETGKLLWQIEYSPWKDFEGKEVGEVFVMMRVAVNLGKENVKWHNSDFESHIQVFDFNLETDELRASTFTGNTYKVDVFTGKITWLSYSK